MATCDSCSQNVKDFVAILKQDHARTNSKHWFICLDCYEADIWETRISRRELRHQTKPMRKPINTDAWDSAIREVIAKDNAPW